MLRNLIYIHSPVILFQAVCVASFAAQASVHQPDGRASAQTESVEFSDGPYFTRLARLRSHASYLGEKEIAELRDMLRQSSEETGLRPEYLHAFKNEIANILFMRNPLPGGLAKQFIAMAEEEKQGPVWRDYCIQHLGANLEKLPPATRKECVELFYRATQRNEAGIAGTALIALSNAGRLPEIDIDRVSRRAYEVAADEDMGPARTTALQICAENGFGEALPLARKLAQSSRDINLRASALAALGMLGGAGEKELLEQSAASGLYRVRTAAKAALARLGRGLKKPSGSLGSCGNLPPCFEQVAPQNNGRRRLPVDEIIGSAKL